MTDDREERSAALRAAVRHEAGLVERLHLRVRLDQVALEEQSARRDALPT